LRFWVFYLGVEFEVIAASVLGAAARDGLVGDSGFRAPTSGVQRLDFRV
jgi:hypothetical protein